MRRIRIEIPGESGGDDVELREEEGVVFGRAPDTAAVREPGIRRLREHVLSEPSVSATHAVVWLEEGRIRLRDLGSRNGTWLRLSRDHVIESAAEGEVHVRLGFPPPAVAPAHRLEPPRYVDPVEYGAGIAGAVQTWLARHDVVARVHTSRGGPGDPSAVIFPLASGEHLVVHAERTVDDRFHHLMVQVSRYVAAQNAVFAAEQETRTDGMILASPSICEVHRRVVEAAMQSTQRLLLLGPSGTGKERLARAYHRHLGQDGPLITVNCATLSAERMVADLFGAEVGAYTGAQRTVVGAVERADGGTLFLDEIGELPLDVQSQLLRFLDTGEYQRLGATGVTRRATVRVVAATNRDLRAMVAEGAFRLDLFFRLALEVVEIPALRERFSDAVAYLGSKQLGACSALDALSEEAMELLRQHPWPGNFRELVNFVQRLPRDAPAASITVDTVRRMLAAGSLPVSETTAPSEPPARGDWMDWLRDAADAFCATRDGEGPRTWGDVTTFIEQYLKPYALVNMAGVHEAKSAESVPVSKVADALKADRGTVTKQLRRYFSALEE